jgi:hypothetical protein
VPKIDYRQARRYAQGLAGLRILFGVLALLLPSRVTEPWVGPTVDEDKRAVLSRALGGRDLALGLGLVLAGRKDKPVRGWVEAGGLADAGDLVATLISFRHLPRLTRWGVLGMTAGAVATAGVLAPALGREQPVQADGTFQPMPSAISLHVPHSG